MSLPDQYLSRVISGRHNLTCGLIVGKLSSFRASLRAQLVKNLPAMWETWVQSLGWEDPPEKGKTTVCSILAWRNAWTVHEFAKRQTRLSDFSLDLLAL